MRRASAGLALTVSVLVGGAAIAGCGGSSSAPARPTTGKAIYKAYCATCHGAQGQGFVGPALAGVVATKYPNLDDQIALVANGKGEMPAWSGRLTPAEIRKVVEYERTGLGT